jgi:glycosyltransferase involved in cell wall biosynthesis
MKIAYVYQSDPKDVGAWSGTPFYMVDALRAQGHEVTLIGPLNVPYQPIFKTYRRALNWFGKHYDFNRHPWVAKSYAAQAKSEIDKGDFDIVVSPSSIPVAYLDVDIPIAIWTDATFDGMVGFYPGNWEQLTQTALRHGHALEQRALTNVTYACYSSDWAAQSARNNYDVDTSKVNVVPFGANLTEVPSREEVSDAIESRGTDECRFLLLGVDWHRKGGDLVLQTAELLRNGGINVHVDVVGCFPPYTAPNYVTCHGFVSKASIEGRDILKRLMRQNHFLFVPSQAECYGLVFAEASAYGLPSISRDIGGISSVIHNGVNGLILASHAKAPDYADAIKLIFSASEQYRKLCYSSFECYESELNWRHAIKDFARQFELQKNL